MAETYFGITDTGQRRTNNEDTFIAEKLNRRFITACVIDGLGGYEGGEVASALARDAILSTLARASDNIFSDLKQAIVEANQRIQKEKESQPEYRQMACVLTLVQADIDNNQFYYAHVGDTRLYLLRDSSLVKITKDQSFVGFLEDNGKLSEDEAMHHPKRNEINKALGFDAMVEADDYLETGDSPFLPGDLLLLCSDGLSDMITSSAITAILSGPDNLKKKAQALIDAANEAGGDDNVTVVLVQNNKKQVQQTAVKPAAQKKDAPVMVTEPVLKKNVEPKGEAVSGKSGNVAVPVLSVLFVCALAAAIFFFYQLKQTETTETETVVPVTVSLKRNTAEQWLSDSINQPLSKVVKVPAGAAPIVISDTLFINKDSLIIHGGGAVITSDSAFSGPAFVLADNCRYVLFDSLSFQDFNIALAVQRTGLHLKNIRFTNCNIPVMQQFIFPENRIVSGSIPRNLFKTDSLYH